MASRELETKAPERLAAWEPVTLGPRPCASSSQDCPRLCGQGLGGWDSGPERRWAHLNLCPLSTPRTFVFCLNFYLFIYISRDWIAPLGRT